MGRVRRAGSVGFASLFVVASWPLSAASPVAAAMVDWPVSTLVVSEVQTGGTSASDDALVLFEVLSPSNRKADQDWRRDVYASVPNCQHYVTVSLRAIEATVYDRASRWKGRGLKTLAGTLRLPALGVANPVAWIYRRTPLGES